MRFARQLASTGIRAFSAQATGSASSASGAPAPANPLAAAKGLSSRCVEVPAQPVGPGAKSDGTYKVPEYYSYNTMSFAEAEIEMAKFRCPQPDSGRQNSL